MQHSFCSQLIFSNIVNSFITSILILKHTSRNTIRKYTLYNGTSVHSYHYNNGNNGMAQSGNKLNKDVHVLTVC